MKKVLFTLTAILFVAITSAQTPVPNSELTWTLEDGTLTISGTDTMPDYTDKNTSPWSGNSDIEVLIIEDGVSTIGNAAFYVCAGLKRVSMPGSLISIGSNAFAYCLSLEGIDIEAEEPPVVGFNVFFLISNAIVVNVPCQSIEDYRADAGWSVFMNITVDGVIAVSNNWEMGYAKVVEILCGENTAIIEAAAYEGYRFVRWQDDNTENRRTVTYNENDVFTAEFEIIPAVGIATTTQQETLTVYPNPTKGIVNIATQGTPEVKICNIYGQLVRISQGTTVNLSDLSNGVYILQIGNQRVSVVKQ